MTASAHRKPSLPPKHPSIPNLPKVSRPLPSGLLDLLPRYTPHHARAAGLTRASDTMANEERQQPLRLGSIAPNFKAETTKGPIDFHEFIGDNWVVLFSHPEDYTPVCTTELGAFAKLQPEFTKRGVKLIGLSANTIDSHEGWIKDIDEISGSKLDFPIIGDKERKVAYAYDMLDYQDTTVCSLRIFSPLCIEHKESHIGCGVVSATPPRCCPTA